MKRRNERTRQRVKKKWKGKSGKKGEDGRRK